jgi:Ice-binding-like
MNCGVPQMHESPLSDSLLACRRPLLGVRRTILRVGLLLLGSLSTLLFASSALASPATVGLGTAAPFSVLAGSTITNTGATTMFGNLGLYPGTSVTGAPQVLGTSYINDQVAIEAKSALTTAFTNAKNRPSEGSAGTDLAGHMFSPGVYAASSSLELSSGSVTLNAEGNPDAVFIFKVGTALTTGSATTVSLINGAQACNVFWQVGTSATLGVGTQFVGTILAGESITANSAATIHGRLLTQTAAVTLENNTITTSNCPSSESGSGGGTETTSGGVTAGGGGSSGGGTTTGGTTTGGTTTGGTTTGGTTTGPAAAGTPVVTTPRKPLASRSTLRKRAKKAAKKRRRHATRAAKHSNARPALPHKRAAFTG